MKLSADGDLSDHDKANPGRRMPVSMVKVLLSKQFLMPSDMTIEQGGTWLVVQNKRLYID